MRGSTTRFAIVAAIAAVAEGLALGGCGVFGSKVDAEKVAAAVEEARPGYSVYANISQTGGAGSEELNLIVATGGDPPSVSEFLAVCSAAISNVDEGWKGTIYLSFVNSQEPLADDPNRWLDIRGVTDQLDIGRLRVTTYSVSGSLTQWAPVCTK